MVQPNRMNFLYLCKLGPWVPDRFNGPVEAPRKNAENAKYARNALCGKVSTIVHMWHICHMSDSSHCCEPCRASDRSTAWKYWIVGKQSVHSGWAAVTSMVYLRSQGLCWSWPYACLLLNWDMHTGNKASSLRRIQKQWIDNLKLVPWEIPQNFLMSTAFSLFSTSNENPA